MSDHREHRRGHHRADAQEEQQGLMSWRDDASILIRGEPLNVLIILGLSWRQLFSKFPIESTHASAIPYSLVPRRLFSAM